MKKIIVFFLALSCVFLASCGKNTNRSEKYAGEWIAVCGEYEKMPLGGNEIENIKLKLHENGRGSVFYNDKKYTGRWKNSENSLNFNLKNKSLTAEIQGNTLTFKSFFEKDFKLVFALTGTKECNPELYMTNEAKDMLGSWETKKIFDIMGNEIPSEKKQNITLTFHSDYTVDVFSDNKSFKKQNWYVSGNFGGLKNGDYDISWELNGEKLDAVILVNGEYLVFHCEKTKN